MPRAFAAVVLACFVIAGAAASAQTPAKPAPEITGRWAMALNITEMGIANVVLVFKQTDGKLTGTYTGRYGEFPLTGTIDARTVAFTVVLDTEGGRSEMAFAGELAEDGQTMKGGATIEGLGEATWTAKKQPAGSGAVLHQ